MANTSPNQLNRSQPLRILVIGGVAGGASAAARARRVNADAEITILEKGPVISFANCGLPYHLGGEIAERKKLLVASPELFWNRFRIAVHTQCEATSINRQQQTVTAIHHATGKTEEIAYDRLILSTGAEPIAPPFWKPATNLRHLWTMDDMDTILAATRDTQVKHVTVVGAGFVGLEVVEQLHRLGLQVSLIERLDQVLPPMDPFMAQMLSRHLELKGIDLHLGVSVEQLKIEADRVTGIELSNGKSLPTDLVIVGAGVRPRTQLAVAAGLTLGGSGGVQVNQWMQTNDPMIYAVGDMAEYVHGVTQESTRVPLAGPANRSGRVAGGHAACGQAETMGPVLGTAIVRVFDLTAACTGLNMRTLTAKGIEFRTAIIQAAQHAGYYPGAQQMQLLIHYAPDDGRILGAQAVGGEGVDKRIDILATTIHFRGTVHHLAQLDLAYAPPFGSAKDPIHMVAFTAMNDLQTLPRLLSPAADLQGQQVVDVRNAIERQQLPLTDSIAIPIDELMERWHELDPHRETVVVCHSGKRAHVAACFLQNKGFPNVRNLTGGMAIRSMIPEAYSSSSSASA